MYVPDFVNIQTVCMVDVITSFKDVPEGKVPQNASPEMLGSFTHILSPNQWHSIVPDSLSAICQRSVK